MTLFFFFNDTATTEIYTLSLHDALPISCTRVSSTTAKVVRSTSWRRTISSRLRSKAVLLRRPLRRDRKSTRLNSSHANISYAVFCLKKKKNRQNYQSEITIDKSVYNESQ